MSSRVELVEAIPAELVEEQLRRIHDSRQFKRSRRYFEFLNYVVLKTLQGHQDELKERTIGIEALGRAPEYDLNEDPVVRVIAGEVRKRLAQYYYEPDHQRELRIEIPTGSYRPEFKFGAVHADPIEAVSQGDDSAPWLGMPTLPLDSKSGVPLHRPIKSLRLWMVVGIAVVALSAAIGWGAFHVWANSAYRQLWDPVFANSGTIVVSVGSVTMLNRPANLSQHSAASVGLHGLFADPVALADAIAISNIQKVVIEHSRASVIQSSTMTTFSDLQKGPVILISGFDNPWTMRLTEPLRFHFVQASVDTFEIVDRIDPGHKVWSINTLTAFDQVAHDYGLVGRFHDPVTEQIVVVAAGIGENGTIAASELLSDRKYLAELSKQGISPRRNQNWEAVVETKMIDGKPGPPHVIASNIW